MPNSSDPKIQKNYLWHLLAYNSFLSFVENKKILDCACGVGYGTYLLAEKATEVIGLDNSYDAINYALDNYNRKNVRFVVGDAEKLPYKNELFDICISIETFEHLLHIHDFIKEIHRVLKPNGLFLFTTPNGETFPYRPKDNIERRGFHVWHYTIQELQVILGELFEFEIYPWDLDIDLTEKKGYMIFTAYKAICRKKNSSIDELCKNRDIVLQKQKELFERAAKNIDKTFLHLGCGEQIHKGFINIDKYVDHPDVIRHDMKDPLYKESSVDLIYTTHAFEHLPIRDGTKALENWYKILKPDGVLFLSLPDLELSIIKVLDPTLTESDYLWYLYTIFGYQTDTNNLDYTNMDHPIDEGQFHLSGYTKQRLSTLLKNIGFEITTIFNYDGWRTPSMWIEAVAKKKTGVIQMSALEQDVVMGTFTNETTYLDVLLDSIKTFLPHIPFILKVSDGPINKNMELLRQEFLSTNKRFWVFLDHDIKFLDSGIIDLAVKNLLRHKFGLIGVYSSYNENYILDTTNLECREVGWVPGYFMMLDAKYLSDVTPDLNLPDPCTAIDTSFCVSVRARGYKIGVSPSVVYHKWKPLKGWEGQGDVINKTNAYLDKKWKGHYREVITPIEVVLEEIK